MKTWNLNLELICKKINQRKGNSSGCQSISLQGTFLMLCSPSQTLRNWVPLTLKSRETTNWMTAKLTIEGNWQIRTNIQNRLCILRARIKRITTLSRKVTLQNCLMITFQSHHQTTLGRSKVMKMRECMRELIMKTIWVACTHLNTKIPFKRENKTSIQQVRMQKSFKQWRHTSQV